MSCLQIKRLSFWNIIFSYSMQQQQSISWSDCDMWLKVDFIWQVSYWTDKKLQSTSQSQTCTKKWSWSLSGGLLPVWSTRAFWILAKSLHLRKKAQQIDEMHQKLQWLQPALVNRMGPVLLHDNVWPHITTTNAWKVEQIGLWSFASSSIFTWLLNN